MVDGIDAQDYDSAIRQFSQRDIPPIVVALSTASSHPPVRVEIVGADDYNEPFVWSPIMAVTMYSPIIDVTDERSADLARKVAIIDSNENLRTAAEVFRRSIIYSDMTADSLSASSAILSAYQVLELCARIIQMEKPENYDEKVSEISRKLQARLSAKTSMTKRAAAIKSAAQALDQLEGKHISLRIECAAEVFGLDKNWIERERRLGKIRNSRIAHPGATPSIFELGMALGADDKSADYEAISIASEMLWHAIRYIDEQGEQP
ncbi:MAG: hypothetical protein LBB54_05410 [Cellulomonadaceae bacterium]|nr:hypothetical protein [Cellulomonadaceae bacterium]